MDRIGGLARQRVAVDPEATTAADYTAGLGGADERRDLAMERFTACEMRCGFPHMGDSLSGGANVYETRMKFRGDITQATLNCRCI